MDPRASPPFSIPFCHGLSHFLIPLFTVAAGRKSVEVMGGEKRYFCTLLNCPAEEEGRYILFPRERGEGGLPLAPPL